MIVILLSTVVVVQLMDQVCWVLASWDVLQEEDHFSWDLRCAGGWVCACVCEWMSVCVWKGTNQWRRMELRMWWPEAEDINNACRHWLQQCVFLFLTSMFLLFVRGRAWMAVLEIYVPKVTDGNGFHRSVCATNCGQTTVWKSRLGSPVEQAFPKSLEDGQMLPFGLWGLGWTLVDNSSAALSSRVSSWPVTQLMWMNSSPAGGIESTENSSRWVKISPKVRVGRLWFHTTFFIC